MAEILVLAEHDADGGVKKVTLELLTAARRLGEPAAVWAGPGAEAAQERLAEYGAFRVYVADSPALTEYVAAPVAGTGEGKEIAGRLAIKTNSGILTDVIDLTAGDSRPVGTHANFGGAITVHATVRKGTPIVALLAKVTERAPAQKRRPPGPDRGPDRGLRWARYRVAGRLLYHRAAR